MKGVVRKYGSSRYIVRDCVLLNLGGNDAPDLVLAGRIIHDTVLEREQLLVDGEIVKDHATLPHAPSAIFVLMLDTHRLIYFAETRGAPKLQALRATIQRAIRDQWNWYIRRRKADLDQRGGRVFTLKELREAEPEPTLRIVPLPTESSIEQFIDGFEVLKKVKLELIKPNDEIDAMAWLNDSRQMGAELGASDAEISYSNRNGLDKKEVAETVAQIAQGGNTEVSLYGTDRNGDRLTGNSEEFKLAVPVDEVSTQIEKAAPELVHVFRDKVEEGLIKLPPKTEENKGKLQKLAQSLVRFIAR